jgi:predicted unusual protein kinase regulating ubiquinone biosynthesis (AarF/ABC1/UbiB family)
MYMLHGLEGEEREEAKRGCHRRGARRLLNVCFKNGGVYIKLGQHIGMLVRAVPMLCCAACAMLCCAVVSARCLYGYSCL